ncbi:MAG: MoaD/ThiS family protein [Actinomycetes bacterium]|jgi:molybdopterin converting factor small subunit
MAVTLRFYAAARKATGTSEMTLEPSVALHLLDQAVAAHPKLLGVLGQCSFLLNEVALHDFDTQVPDGSTLDVLPPFAGG